MGAADDVASAAGSWRERRRLVDGDGAGLRVSHAGRAALRRAMRELQQAWPRPAHPRPIVVIGAGAIVRTAHLPAYLRLGFPVAGLFDIESGRASATADEFGVARVHAA